MDKIQGIMLHKICKIVHYHRIILHYFAKLLDRRKNICYHSLMEKKYYKHKIENLLVIGKIVTIHYFEFHKNFYFPPESHDFWELVYADKGDVICGADEDEVILKEGEMLFHKPLESHSLRADGQRAPNVFIISFECKSEAIHFFENRKIKVDKSLLRLIFNIIEESKQTFDLPYSDPELKRMKLLSSPALGGQQIIKNQLEILLIQLMRKETMQNPAADVFLPRDQFDEVIANRVIGFMKENLSKNLSIDDICAVLHYNRSYIFRQFKKSTGYSVMSYFNKLKIDHAKRLLRETDLSVAAISESLGFESSNYFSKIFKKYSNYTPSTYRKIRRKG